MFAKKITVPSKKVGDINIQIKNKEVTLQSKTLELRSLNQDPFDAVVDNFSVVLGKAENIALLQDGKTWSRDRVSVLVQEEQLKQNQGCYFSFFSAYRLTDSQFIGCFSARYVANQYSDIGKGHKHAVEIGYFIDKPFWGQGYGTEMTIMGKKYIKQMALHHAEYNIVPKPEEIVATAHPENVGSIKILEKTLKNKENETLIKFGGNPRLFFYKPLPETSLSVSDKPTISN